MSTALVSAFYDMGDILYQNQKNLNRSQPQTSVVDMDQLQQLKNMAPMLNRNRSASLVAATTLQQQQASQDCSNFTQQTLSQLISFNDQILINREAAGLDGLSCVNSGVAVPSTRGKFDRSMSEPVGQDKLNSNQVPSRNSSLHSSRYKTEMCRPFEENGHCKYGDKCQFAHGIQELKSLNRHPKYKTELCRTFHTIGFCPYGPRCHFVHSEDEHKLGHIAQMKMQQAVNQQNQIVTSVPTPSQPIPMSGGNHRYGSQAPLNFSLDLPPFVRDSLGSIADSPPSSMTSSPPTLSPTCFLSDDSSSVSSRVPMSAFSPVTGAYPGADGAFSFHNIPAPVPSTPSPTMTQQQHSPQYSAQMPDPISSLAAGLQAASLNHRNNNITAEVLRDCLHDVFYSGYVQQENSPPSPPDSINGDSHSVRSCGSNSPLDVSRGLRLPIFNHFSDLS